MNYSYTRTAVTHVNTQKFRQPTDTVPCEPCGAPAGGVACVLASDEAGDYFRAPNGTGFTLGWRLQSPTGSRVPSPSASCVHRPDTMRAHHGFRICCCRYSAVGNPALPFDGGFRCRVGCIPFRLRLRNFEKKRHPSENNGNEQKQQLQAPTC